MSAFSNFVKKNTGIKLPDLNKELKNLQKEGDRALNDLKGALDTEVKGLQNTIRTELTGAGKTLGMNVNQDFMPNVQLDLEKIAQIVPNLNQDFTKISLTGLAKEVPKIGEAIQDQTIRATSALQQNAITLGETVQQNAINFGSKVQQETITLGKELSGGQSNPTLEKVASGMTSATETNIQSFADAVSANEQGVTKGAEKNFEGITQTTEDLVSSNVGGIEGLPQDTSDFIENVKDGFQLFIDQFLPGGKSDGKSVGPGDTSLPETPDLGEDNAVFDSLEQSTTKADQMSEEERQRRIRRLMLNRYGREGTILTGAKDPFNRRRYASAL